MWIFVGFSTLCGWHKGYESDEVDNDRFHWADVGFFDKWPAGRFVSSRAEWSKISYATCIAVEYLPKTQIIYFKY